MLSTRIASLAACLLVGTAAFPLHAQPLTSTSPFSASVPVALKTNDALSEIDTSAQLEANIDEAVTNRVLFQTPRKRVADLAMRLRNIRYIRAGHDPSTGFDCSGFTHYVYHQTYGLDLPYDAPGQYRDGQTVSRDGMRTGDLVFFHVGKRITHVGIYLDDGHFIHSPRPGKSVRVDSLDNTYWAKRFAGAKRPNVIS